MPSRRAARPRASRRTSHPLRTAAAVLVPVIAALGVVLPPGAGDPGGVRAPAGPPPVAPPAVVAAQNPTGALPTTASGVRNPRPAPGTVVAAGPVTVAALLERPVAEAVVRVDGEPRPVRLDTGETPTVAADVALGPGRHEVEIDAEAVDGTRLARRWTVDAADVAVDRLAGADRYATAAAVSTDAHPAAGSAPAAVLARGDAFADALAGVPLAAAVGGPLLLAEPDGLPDPVAAELARVVPAGGTVHLLGGTAALGPAVETAVRDLGLRVRRHAGPDRAGTAAAVAAELTALGPAGATGPRTAVVVSGEDFPDALAASVPAAVRGWPVLLAGTAGVPDATLAALEDASVQEVVLVGGEAVLPAAIAAALPGAVRRVAGPDRWSTAAAVAEELGGGTGGGTVTLAAGRAFPDALAGAAHAARLGAPLLLAEAAGLPPATRAAVAARRPPRTLVYGGADALRPGVEADVRAAVADGPGGPGVVAVEPGDGTELDGAGPVTVTLDAPVTAAEGAVYLGAQEVAGKVTVDGPRVTFTPAGVPTAGDEPLRLELTARVEAAGAVRHVAARWTVVPPPPTARSPEGFVVAGGGSEAVGDGPVRTFTVELEHGTGHTPSALVDVVEAALLDPRGWTARGERSLQRVDDPATADVRVVLARPGTVDAYCARAGLRTGGVYSCWDGRRAMLNLDRYETGAPPFAADLAVYRAYLVNHEVGHGLGYGHVGCPAAGALAPVMMQQTKGTGACLPNPWPYPDG